jgi:hypothetical protein
VDKKKWQQFTFYVLSSVIGVCLDLFAPNAKYLLCLPGLTERGNSVNTNPRNLPTPTIDRPNLQWQSFYVGGSNQESDSAPLPDGIWRDDYPSGTDYQQYC